MVMRRLPHSLPGTDPLLLQKILLIPYLCLVVVILALSAVMATVTGAQGGHLPWPIAQWALTTPLGALALALVGGLVWGLPLLLVLRVKPVIVRPVDVTELPLFAWPRSLSLWRTRPGDGTLADFWLGHGWLQRALTLLMFAFAALLLIGLVVAFAASGWYALTHLADCVTSSCPPPFDEQLVGPPELVGLVIMFLSQFAQIAHLERRCGIWFRGRDIVESSVGAYVRRPGVTPEAAAAALQRYIPDARRPMARLALVVVLALTPAFLLLIGGELLSTWLSTQWIPA